MGCLIVRGNPFCFFTIHVKIISLLLIQNTFLLSQIKDFTTITFDTLTKNPTSFLVSADYKIYILSSHDNVLIKMDSDGSFIKSIGGKGWNVLNFYNPTSIYSSDNLNIFVADCYNSRILRYNRNLEFLSLYSWNSDNQKHRILYPFLIAVDNFGKLFTFDRENKKFYKISTDSKVEDVFGELEFSKSSDVYPKKLLIDSNNNLYTSDKNRLLIYSNWGFLLKQLKYESQILSFCVTKENLFIIIDDKLLKCNLTGDVLFEYELQSLFPMSEKIEIFDITIRNNYLFILTADRVLKINIDNILNWKIE